MDKPTMLVVLDGFGVAPASKANAVTQANMPFWRQLETQYPKTLLRAAGEDVGLLAGSIGNSEVGHMTLGAGRVVPSALLQFDQLLAAGSLTSNESFAACIKSLKSGARVHLMGLLSDGGVHSHERHLHALLKAVIASTSAEIFIHPFLDGRDVLPASAAQYLTSLEGVCRELGRGSIASVQGRFYAMDRDHNIERTSVAVRMLRGQVPVLDLTWQQVLEKSYKHGVTDEFVVPVLLNAAGNIRPGDGVIFFNTRPDRARQITTLFLDGVPEEAAVAFFLTPVCYDQKVVLSHHYALFKQPKVDDTLLHVLATAGKRVVIAAETEKYAHVTYFFQGQHEEQLPHQERLLIPSLKVKDYVLRPEMAAHQITSALIKSLRSEPAFFYLVNFANPDMVGHSGNLPATIKACEVIDQQLALLYHEVVVRAGGVLCITADHGNAECKQDEQGHELTAHTKNPVPFVVAGKHMAREVVVKNEPMAWGLAHVASTLLGIMGIPVPVGMAQKITF